MKGKYISISLILAVLAGGNGQPGILVDETMASTVDHETIWTKMEQQAIVSETAEEKLA